MKENCDGEAGELGAAGREASECIGPGVGELDSPAADTKAAKGLSIKSARARPGGRVPELTLEIEGG